ncbi:YhaN family protein [Alteribacter keqinensis]|uniref:Nucleoside triphosphate hydrolase n=1 Tax=Alteribacter keqinensis TaxID=2483800 RepID=A0A3M7TV88_9BACI|nr:YhaN family protein [Alteribacter keqinensis]RNA69363.1 nucleoside triphosphate hydrolase [Alteribacter keqinensis]
MRFDYLTLKAFGHFTDFDLPFEKDKNFHFIYGPNEAGKSTILRSVANFLYGFPQQTADSFLHDNKKLLIEGQLSRKDGETLRFMRRKGRKNTVLDLNQNPIDEKFVSRFYDGLTQDHFLNIFALDHVRLREGGESLLQSDGNAGESIFSAASGISMLRDVLKDIEDHAGKLYVKGGSTREINQSLRKEKEISKEIAENQLKLQDWKDLERKYEDGKREIDRLTEEINILGRELQKIERIEKTLPKIALRNELKKKRERLGELPNLPEEARELRKENEKLAESSSERLKEIDQLLKRYKDRLDSLHIPEHILEQEAEITSIYRGVNGYIQDVNELPRLEGEMESLQNSVYAALKTIDRNYTSLTDAESLRLSAEKRKRLLSLADEKPLLDQNLKSTSSDAESLDREVNELESELRAFDDIPDSEELEYVLESVQKHGDVEERLKQKKLEIESLKIKCAHTFRSLSFWEGSYEDLIGQPIPAMRETIKQFEKVRRDLKSIQEKTFEKQEEEKAAIADLEASLRSLDALADVPTESELQKERMFRNTGWVLIRNQLNERRNEISEIEAFSKGLPLELAFENSMKKADELTDVMKREAEKVGEKNKLLADKQSSIEKLESLTSELENLNTDLTTWKEDWNDYWLTTSVNPGTPEEMLEWLNRYEQVMAHHEQLETANAHYTDLEHTYQTLKESLIKTLSELENTDTQRSLGQLVNQALRVKKCFSEQRTRKDVLRDKYKQKQEQYEAVLKRKRRTEDDVKEWGEEWESAIEGLPVTSATPASVVKDLLENYDSCVTSYDEYLKIKRSKDAMETRVSGFEEDVIRIDQEVVSTLKPRAMDTAVTSLYELLQKTKEDRRTVLELKKKIQEAGTEKEAAVRAEKEAEHVLNELMIKAGCETLSELVEAESKFKEAQELFQKITSAEEQLLAIGAGQTLEELLAEAAETAADSLALEKGNLEKQVKELEDQKSEVLQIHGVNKKEYQEKIQGTNDRSVKAESEKQSILSKIARDTDDYINQKLASVLLRKGIDYYREQNQSPIVKRASEIFKRLTLDHFDGIVVEFDEKDQPVLMGLRQTDTVPVSGMSDGTTDQLYLALRIASIERFAAENEPVPFVVDDILVHFDDDRARETLRILLELSRLTQVIFFTHHSRLESLMKEADSDQQYQMTRLETTVSAGLF